MSAVTSLSTVAGKIFAKICWGKKDFPIGYCIANADIESLKPLHTLFDKHLNPMLVKLEQNCMVRNTISNF